MAKPLRRRIGEKITALQDNLAGDVKKLTATEKKYRLRVGDYRVIYRIDEGKRIVIVVLIAHRREAYP